MKNEDISPPASRSEEPSGYADDAEEWNRAKNRQRWIGWVGIALRIALSIIVVLIGGVFSFSMAVAVGYAGDSESVNKAHHIIMGGFVVVTLLLIGIWRIGR